MVLTPASLTDITVFLRYHLLSLRLTPVSRADSYLLDGLLPPRPTPNSGVDRVKDSGISRGTHGVCLLRAVTQTHLITARLKLEVDPQRLQSPSDR